VRLLDLGSQQVAVLESNCGRVAFQVHEQPAVVLRISRGLIEARVRAEGRDNERGEQERCFDDSHGEPFTGISHYKLMERPATGVRES